MRIIALLFLAFYFFPLNTQANFVTPGNGVKWNLNDLVNNAPADAGFSAGVYTIKDTIYISLNDTLELLSDATVKFAAATFFDVNGTLIINPPSGVLFTADNISSGYYGLRIDSSNATTIRKLTFEYANSLRLFDSNIKIDSCIFRNNTPLTTFGNAAVSLFRSNPLITNSQFINNQRAAIQGGANINNAPKIINCLFMANNTLNGNVPQINLGASGSISDTVQIINNHFIGGSTNSGAIGFLPLGNVYALISGNVIKNNRYGITFNGGANINAIVSYNVIDSNNIQNDPALGGSGISLTGGSATSHQNTIITGNFIRWNLWGITIQGGAKPNIGNLGNSDTSDNGKNYFAGNTNATTPGIHLYNNSPDSIFAQNNYWGTSEANFAEAGIFHAPDNAALGFVSYLPLITQNPLPVTLVRFAGHPVNQKVLLYWTISTTNIDHFKVERSSDGGAFETIGNLANVTNTAATSQYTFTDENPVATGRLFYRLKFIEHDGHFSYSPVLTIKPFQANKTSVKIYPNPFTGNTGLTAYILSNSNQVISIRLKNANGSVTDRQQHYISAGENRILIPIKKTLPEGVFFIEISGKGISENRKIIKAR